MSRPSTWQILALAATKQLFLLSILSATSSAAAASSQTVINTPTPTTLWERTILGPLTTTWTPPPACSVVMASCDTCNGGYMGQTCPGSTTIADNTDCWPPASGAAKTQSPPIPLFGWGFYSPGLECPMGYVTACSATAGATGGGAEWAPEYSLVAGETAVGCCPSGFTCDEGGSGHHQTCKSVATSGSFPTATCNNGQTDAYSVVTIPNLASNYTLLAPLFQLNHQASDLPSTSGGSTTGTGSSTGSPNSGSGSSGGSSGLSTGAKAGIGIGVALGAIFVIVGAGLLWRRNSRKKSAARGHDTREELEGSKPVHELEMRPQASELPA